MPLKAHVDHDLCIASGLCVNLVPKVFEIDDTIGQAQVLGETVPESLVADVRKAQAGCPSEAISTTEVD